MSLADNALSDNEKTKLKQFFDQGIKTLQDIESRKEDIKALNDGLKETAKALGEELETEGAILMKALTAAHKDTIEDERKRFETMEMILAEVGRG